MADMYRARLRRMDYLRRVLEQIDTLVINLARKREVTTSALSSAREKAAQARMDFASELKSLMEVGAEQASLPCEKMDNEKIEMGAEKTNISCDQMMEVGAKKANIPCDQMMEVDLPCDQMMEVDAEQDNLSYDDKREVGAEKDKLSCDKMLKVGAKKAQLSCDQMMEVSVEQPAPAATKRKRSGETMGEAPGPDTSFGEDLAKLLTGLQVEGSSILDCVELGKGEDSSLSVVSSMGEVTGKRISAITAEIFYLTAHGMKSITAWEDFEKQLRLDSAKEGYIFSRSILYVLGYAKTQIMEYMTDAIEPELHDLLYSEVLQNWIERSGSAVTEIDLLLSQKRMAKTSTLAGEKLEQAFQGLISVDEDLSSVETTLDQWRPVYGDYRHGAQKNIDAFLEKMKSFIQQLWDAQRTQKRAKPE